MIFDAHWYGRHVPAEDSPVVLEQHYRDLGWRLGLSPSPYFDPAWYLASLGAGAALDLDPLLHFEQTGAADLRDPHPLFNARWYAWTNPGASQSAHPLAHYLTEGWRQGLRPHPLFWADWYARTYLGPRAGKVDPLLHYLVEGWRRGCKPNPLFDVTFYRAQAWPKAGPDADAGAPAPPEQEPLAHYIQGGHRRFDPHPLFDSAHFRSGLNPDQRGSAISPLEYYFGERRDVNPHPLFDPAFYQARAGAPSPGLEGWPPLARYLAQSSAAGSADPHPLFSRATRAKADPSGDADPLEHYVAGGWRNGGAVHPLFDAGWYSQTYAEADGREPLRHYLELGAAAGLAPRAPETPPDTRPRAPMAGRQIAGMSRDAGAARPPLTVAALMHVFHTDLAPELFAAVANIKAECTLFVTTDSVAKAREIDALCAESWRGEDGAARPVRVRVLPNRGRNIGPLLCGLRDVLTRFDLAVHVHTKRSPHERLGADWRRHMLDGLLGTPALVDGIMAAFAADPRLGLLAPDHHAAVRGLLQWGGNFNLAAALLGMAGEDGLSREHALDFPSGGMMWFRPAALGKLLGLGLEPYHFEPESGQLDGTLAHAIERVLYHFVEAAGYRWAVGRPVAGAGSALPITTNRLFPTDSELGALRRHYPECTRFALRPSQVTRPRLNLLLPTLDERESYAGAATALRLFHALRAELGSQYDARLLATDVSPGSRYSPPEGYMIMEPGADAAGRDTVEDAARRFRFPVAVRDGDVFLATAWWTAANAVHMLGQQDALFGERQRRFIYLVQDYEPLFYPSSTQWGLADATYSQLGGTALPVFNTEPLRHGIAAAGHGGAGDDALVLEPGINPQFQASIRPGTAKERLVLLYARTRAERNCLSFLDLMLAAAFARDPAGWAGWRFLAVGEDLPGGADGLFPCAQGRVEWVGRLGLDEYAATASRAALGVSLMASPHPSYVPMELAEAGVLVVSNTWRARDPAGLHENIAAFTRFDAEDAAAVLDAQRRRWEADPAGGWAGQPKAGWFFGGRTNLAEIARSLAAAVRQAAGGTAPELTVVTGAGRKPLRKAI